MKRYVLLLIGIFFFVSACTLTLPDLMDVRIINVEFEDSGNLSVFLRNAEEGFFVQVGGQTYDCVMLEDPSGVLKCTGPGFAPGEEQVLKFFAK
ncbi:MAG: hypothetical protein E4H33_05505, partial [Anaerolineales bacterium]